MTLYLLADVFTKSRFSGWTDVNYRRSGVQGFKPFCKVLGIFLEHCQATNAHKSIQRLIVIEYWSLVKPDRRKEIIDFHGKITVYYFMLRFCWILNFVDSRFIPCQEHSEHKPVIFGKKCLLLWLSIGRFQEQPLYDTLRPSLLSPHAFSWTN